MWNHESTDSKKHLYIFREVNESYFHKSASNASIITHGSFLYSYLALKMILWCMYDTLVGGWSRGTGHLSSCHHPLLHLTPYTLHLTPYTLHLTPYTLA